MYIVEGVLQAFYDNRKQREFGVIEMIRVIRCSFKLLKY